MKYADIYHYMDVACLTAKRSYAKRAQVGSIIVKNRNIISEGYNGTYPGCSNMCETEDGSKTLPNVIHAEKNAILKMCKSTNSSEGASIFITHEPCNECASLIILAGIKEVYYRNEYSSKNYGSGLELLMEHGIDCYHVTENSIDKHNGDNLGKDNLHIRESL